MIPKNQIYTTKPPCAILEACLVSSNFGKGINNKRDQNSYYCRQILKLIVALFNHFLQIVSFFSTLLDDFKDHIYNKKSKQLDYHISWSVWIN